MRIKNSIIAVSVLCLFLLTRCSKEDVNNITSNLNNRSVGASANEFLSSAKYQSLNIEIAYMPGYAPDLNGLTNLQSFLKC